MPRPASPLGQGWCLLRWLLRMLSVEQNCLNFPSAWVPSARAAPTQQRAAVLERSPRFRKLHAGFAIFERYQTFCRATFAPKPGHIAVLARLRVIHFDVSSPSAIQDAELHGGASRQGQRQYQRRKHQPLPNNSEVFSRIL